MEIGLGFDSASGVALISKVIQTCFVSSVSDIKHASCRTEPGANGDGFRLLLISMFVEDQGIILKFIWSLAI